MTQPRDTDPPSPDAEVVFYNATPHDDTPLEVRPEQDILWLTQKRLACGPT